MRDIPAPGTWVRLTRAGLPAGKWHHVVGWNEHDERLQLVCRNRDRNISWAIHGPGMWAVDRSSRRPVEDACGTCRHRDRGTSLVEERPRPLERTRARVAFGFVRIGPSAWVSRTPDIPLAGAER